MRKKKGNTEEEKRKGKKEEVVPPFPFVVPCQRAGAVEKGRKGEILGEKEERKVGEKTLQHANFGRVCQPFSLVLSKTPAWTKERGGGGNGGGGGKEGDRVAILRFLRQL